jgi:hypothetical protein
MKNTTDEIKQLLDENTINDLKRFLNKRQCLNTTNSYLIYLFHLVQSAGILTSSYAVSNNDNNLAWIGISLSVFATLIHTYEKTNNFILKKTMNNINTIKEGKYVDEDCIVEFDKISHQKPEDFLLKSNNYQSIKTATNNTETNDT